VGKYCYVASARRRATGEERGRGMLCRHAHSLLSLPRRLWFRFICLLVELRETTQPIFTKFGWKVGHGPRKNTLDFGDSPLHITLGLRLWLTSHVIAGRTVLQFGEDRVIPRNTGYVSAGVCLIMVKGNCWALTEVCALLSAVLVCFCLLGTLHENCWSDFQENFTRDVSSDEEVTVNFWKSSGSGSGSRRFMKDFLPLWDGGIHQLLLITQEVVEK